MAVMLLMSRALAGEPEEITVVGEGTLDPAAGPSQVTVVEVADLPASADVATAVARAPGVVVRRLGGLGDLAQVGIRGAGARHVEVLVDSIPLNPEGGAAVDLSELPLSAFSRVEVYRGAAPALLGVTALGGAISLVPGEARGSSLALGVGSQQALHGTGTLGAKGRWGHFFASADALASRGLFRYFDDGGTRSLGTDDTWAVRENNDTLSLSTLARWQYGPVSLLHAGTWRSDGVPGFTFAPSQATRYQLGRQLMGLRLKGAAGSTELSSRIYGLYRRDHLLDPEDELGIGALSSADRTGSLGLDGSARVLVSRTLRAEGALGGRVDHYDSAALQTGRWVGRATAALPWNTERVDLVPALVGVGLFPMGEGLQEGQGFVLPRAGAVFRSGAWALKGNAGAFARPPDLIELYGDRGVLVGNPALSPERGTQLDLGGVYQRSHARAEAVGFLADYRDLIVWTTGPQGVARADNVSRALVTGLELALSAERAPWRLSSQLTFTRALNTTDDPTYRGNQLPREPIAEGFVELGVEEGPLRASVDASGTAGTWVDTANFARQPARLLLGTTLALHDRRDRLSLELDLRNLLGTRTALVPRDPLVDDGELSREPIVDFTGYPLPGRTAWLSVRWRN